MVPMKHTMYGRCPSSSLYIVFRLQAFINYNLLYTRFHAHKIALGARLCMWESVHVKEQMCTLLIITWYGGRNCTKLVLKPLKLKMVSLFQSCVLLSSCRLYYFSLHDDYLPFLYCVICLYGSTTIFDELKWEGI